MGFKSWPFLRFLLPLPLAAWATFLALSMATLAPFILAVPATRRPGVGGGVGREALAVVCDQVESSRGLHLIGGRCSAGQGGGLPVSVSRFGLPAVAPPPWAAISSIAGGSS
jgi:hypothetical protein